MSRPVLLRFLIVFLLPLRLPAAAGPAPVSTSISIKLDQPEKSISPDLFGIFFEDLNWAADGGLYAELIQNRSFEYQPTEQPTWNALTAWELATRGGGKGSLAVEAAVPIHPNNPHYVVVEVKEPGTGVGLLNPGFDGIPVKAGASYNLSLFAKQLYLGERWKPAPNASESEPAIPVRDGKNPGPIIARLENKEGENLGEVSLDWPRGEWTHLTATLTSNQTVEAARLVILITVKSGLAFDVISLFPQETFHHRANGLRADLGQTIAELKPHFMRFPGGCLAHGNGLGNMYRWKETIGPIETRREQANLWGYHQTVGLGYFEYFQFCEDIGAKPLPVVPAAVCCQNSDHTSNIGQRGLPLEQMADYIQEVLDLIEYANGPATSPWGAKRAAAGHPQPFHLEYLGVGNEDKQTPEFRERFKLIYEAVKAKHPEITIVGTVGPFPAGEDFEAGWKFGDALNVDVVDEHYYEKPEWFLSNLHRYDSYNRAKSKVYVGEYAAHEKDRSSTLRSALAEAAYMTSLERNGDVVRFASYAPLLARVSHTQWTPDLIYFTSTGIFPTVNYQVQQLFGNNSGDTYLPATVTGLNSAPETGAVDFSYSATKDSHTGELILKFVNVSGAVQSVHIELPASFIPATEATTAVLTGNPTSVNSQENPKPILPKFSAITVGHSFDYAAPANSLTVIRVKASR